MPAIGTMGLLHRQATRYVQLDQQWASVKALDHETRHALGKARRGSLRNEGLAIDPCRTLQSPADGKRKRLDSIRYPAIGL